jgi:hypothetical protein
VVDHHVDRLQRLIFAAPHYPIDRVAHPGPSLGGRLRIVAS